MSFLSFLRSTRAIHPKSGVVCGNICTYSAFYRKTFAFSLVFLSLNEQYLRGMFSMLLTRRRKKIL